MESTSPEAFARHIRIYIGVFVALIVFTVVTVLASSWKPAVPAAAVVLALAIASIKGSLVAGYFMHLKEEKPIILWLIVLTLFLLLVLLVLPLAGLLTSMTGNAG